MKSIVNSILTLIILILIPNFGQSQSKLNTEKNPQILLQLGKSHKMKVSTIGNIHVSNSKILKVVDFQNYIQLVPRKEGVCFLRVGTRSYQIIIFSEKQLYFYKDLQAKVKNLLGLQLEFRKKKVIVSGQLYRFSDWLALHWIQLKHPESEYFFQAQVDLDIQDQVLDYFKNNLFSSHLDVQFERLNYTPYPKIYFSENKKQKSDLILSLIKPFGLAPIFLNAYLDIKPLIRAKITVAEVNKKLSLQWGVQWEKNIKAQLIPETKNLTLIEPSLRALEENGMGKILASPNLLCKSGEKAEFLAGGEFPIKVVGFKTSSSVTWKRHGILLSIKPTADSLGHINLEIETEVSMIDPSQTVEGIPGLKTNRISTHFNLNKPQTILLSGLIKKQWGKSKEGIPLLMKIPIIGSLFSSSDYINDETELLVFVTPEIVNENSNSITSKETLKPTDYWVQEFLNDEELEL